MVCHGCNVWTLSRALAVMITCRRIAFELLYWLLPMDTSNFLLMLDSNSMAVLQKWLYITAYLALCNVFFLSFPQINKEILWVFPSSHCVWWCFRIFQSDSPSSLVHLWTLCLLLEPAISSCVFGSDIASSV